MVVDWLRGMDTPRLEMTLRGVRTRFLGDRIRETAFEDCTALLDLIVWEGMAAEGAPQPAGMFQRGHGDWRFWCRTEARHRVECACIVEELRAAAYTDPEAYRARRAAHDAAERDARRRAAEEAAARAETRAAALRQAWIRGGGGASPLPPARFRECAVWEGPERPER